MTRQTPLFTTVALPQQLSFPPTGNSTVDKVIGDYLTYVSLSAAALHAAERWQGAIGVGDQTSLALQLKAYHTYSQQASAALAVSLADNSALAQALPSVPIQPPDRRTRIPSKEAQLIADAFNAQCGQPLPSDLNASLLSLSIPQATIDSMVCDAVGKITPKDINTDFKALLLELAYLQ